MNGEKKSEYSLNRRTVLRCVLSGVSTTIAGCGDSSEAGRPSGKTSLDPVNPSGGVGPDAPDEIAEDIEDVFDRLSQFPIVRNREFVFKVRTVEDEFDYRELMDKVDSVKARLGTLELEEESGVQKADLVLVTEVAENLVRQRIIVHQIIASGITFEELFGEGEYARATETIRDGISFLNSLSNNREDVITQVTQADTKNLPFEAYNAESVEETQAVLGEILRWTPHAYRGLYDTVQGLQNFESGNSALNNKELGIAGSAYKEAEVQFRLAKEAFERAHGQGRRLPQIAPLVDGVRCMLPAYQTSSVEFQKSINEFKTGNESRAKEIGREAVNSSNKVAQRCL